MKKLVAILMVLTLAMSALVVSASAAQTDKDSTGATGITVHYYTEKELQAFTTGMHFQKIFLQSIPV